MQGPSPGGDRGPVSVSFQSGALFEHLAASLDDLPWTGA